MDNYEPKEYHFDIKDSADAQFNNIQYMYIGKNESMADGFVGCVSRVEFDDIYPLKILFQENGPANVKSIGSMFSVLLLNIATLASIQIIGFILIERMIFLFLYV